MPDTKISGMTAVLSVIGSELLPCVQTGSNRHMTPNLLLDFLEIAGTATAGITPAYRRSHTSRNADSICLMDFSGMVGDGSTNDSAAIQVAIDWANAKYVATGQMVYLYLANRTYALGSTCTMKSGVVFYGPGTFTIRNATTFTGNVRALFTANGIRDFGFHNLTAYGVGPDRIVAAQCQHSASLGLRDSFLDMNNCSYAYFSDLRLFRFQNAFLITVSNHLQFDRIYIDSLSQAKTLAQMDQGTFTDWDWTFGGVYGSYGHDPGAGFRFLGERGGVLQGPCDQVTIRNCVVICPGLDISYDIGSSNHYSRRFQIQNCLAMGTMSGFQVYAGNTPADPGDLLDTNGGVQIVGCYSLWTWQQGFYIRGRQDTHVVGSLAYRCCGIGNHVGNSCGAFMLRSNPYDGYSNSLTSGTLKEMRRANSIDSCWAIDCGRLSDGTLDGAIRCDSLYAMIRNCTVERSLNRFGTLANLTNVNSYGIRGFDIGPDSQWYDVKIHGCRVRGFGNGIYGSWTNTGNGTQPGGAVVRNGWVQRGAHSADIRNNTVDTCTNGIMFTCKSSGFLFEDNIIKNATVGASLTNMPFSTFKDNRLISCTTGLILAGGNLLSDYYRVVDGFGTPRMGPTLIVTDNELWDCATPWSVSGTTNNDTTYLSRVAIFRGNSVDGFEEIRDGTTGFTLTADPTTMSATSRPARTWLQGEIWKLRTVSAGGKAYLICLTSGTTGGTLSNTVTASSGATVLTANNLSGIVPGVYITIAGVTGTKRVVSIDIVNLTFVIDSGINVGVSNALVSYSNPVFKPMCPIDP